MIAYNSSPLVVLRLLKAIAKCVMTGSHPGDRTFVDGVDVGDRLSIFFYT
ncbi:hypothetical protein [Fischerella sp. JS2]|nr:hypothetical protein [Fischerella sp. JS2]